MDAKRTDCATRVMETIPLMMRTLGDKLDSQGRTRLSFPHFHALMFIGDHPGINLSLLAHHLGATLSATSKLIDSFIQDGYAQADTAEHDRRLKLLSLTPAGVAAVRAVQQGLITYLAEQLGELTDGECAMVALAMKILGSAFTPPAVPAGERRSPDRR